MPSSKQHILASWNCVSLVDWKWFVSYHTIHSCKIGLCSQHSQNRLNVTTTCLGVPGSVLSSWLAFCLGLFHNFHSFPQILGTCKKMVCSIILPDPYPAIGIISIFDRCLEILRWPAAAPRRRSRARKWRVRAHSVTTCTCVGASARMPRYHCPRERMDFIWVMCGPLVNFSKNTFAKGIPCI